MEKAAPWPTSEVTAILPPWAPTMCFTMASPSPEPSMERCSGSRAR